MRVSFYYLDGKVLVIRYGSDPLKTYVPESDIDVTVLSRDEVTNEKGGIIPSIESDGKILSTLDKLKLYDIILIKLNISSGSNLPSKCIT